MQEFQHVRFDSLEDPSEILYDSLLSHRFSIPRPAGALKKDKKYSILKVLRLEARQ